MEKDIRGRVSEQDHGALNCAREVSLALGSLLGHLGAVLVSVVDVVLRSFPKL